MEFLTLARRFGPALAFALLLAAVGYLYMDGRTLRSDLKLADTRVADVTAANAMAAKALDAAAKQRADNDAIAAAVALKLSGNAARETHTQTIIERAVASDPVSKDWSIVPVPVGVRAGLSAH